VSLAPRTVLAVASGGALGSVLRWAVEALLPASPGSVPWTTLAVNVLGSALLGAVVVELGRGSPTRRAFLATGVLGGFTTFSTYAVQVTLLGARDPVLALVYATLTPALCVGAAWSGAAGMRRRGGRS
jgi:fluoride exporter